MKVRYHVSLAMLLAILGMSSISAGDFCSGGFAPVLVYAHESDSEIEEDPWQDELDRVFLQGGEGTMADVAMDVE